MRDERQELADLRVQAARAGLACRVDELERRVVGAVDSATESVRETAGTIRSAVSEAKVGAQDLYHKAADGAKHLLDVPHHIRAYPWPSVGLAALAGFVVGSFGKKGVEVISSRANFSAPRLSEFSPSTLFGELMAVAKRELQGLGESAILAASRAVQDNIRAASASFATAGTHEHNGYHHEAVPG